MICFISSLPVLIARFLSAARPMTCGTAWARCCRLRGTPPPPPSVSSPPWSWRPAAPSCPSPSFPEHYETHVHTLTHTHSLLWPQYCSTTHTHTQHACTPEHMNTHVLPRFPSHNATLLHPSVGVCVLSCTFYSFWYECACCCACTSTSLCVCVCPNILSGWMRLYSTVCVLFFVFLSPVQRCKEG